ncbi:MAG: hypothetical protein ACOC3D_10690, partial [Pseudomonadota bacterium]
DAGWTRIEPIKAEIKARLLDHFGIGHSSLEFEHIDHAHENAALFGHDSEAGAPRPATGPAGHGA